MSFRPSVLKFPLYSSFPQHTVSLGKGPLKSSLSPQTLVLVSFDHQHHQLIPTLTNLFVRNNFTWYGMRIPVKRQSLPLGFHADCHGDMAIFWFPCFRYICLHYQHSVYPRQLSLLILSLLILCWDWNSPKKRTFTYNGMNKNGFPLLPIYKREIWGLERTIWGWLQHNKCFHA